MMADDYVPGSDIGGDTPIDWSKIIGSTGDSETGSTSGGILDTLRNLLGGAAKTGTGTTSGGTTGLP